MLWTWFEFSLPSLSLSKNFPLPRVSCCRRGGGGRRPAPLLPPELSPPSPLTFPLIAALRFFLLFAAVVLPCPCPFLLHSRRRSRQIYCWVEPILGPNGVVEFDVVVAGFCRSIFWAVSVLCLTARGHLAASGRGLLPHFFRSRRSAPALVCLVVWSCGHTP